MINSISPVLSSNASCASQFIFGFHSKVATRSITTPHISYPTALRSYQHFPINKNASTKFVVSANG
jgi:hypothetical protein